MSEYWNQVANSALGYSKIGIQILVLYLIIYSVLGFIRGTRGAPILAGLTILTLIVGLFSTVLKLEVLSWLLSNIWGVIPFSILVIFQPELRRAFAELGTHQQRTQATGSSRKSKETIDVLIETAFYLAERKIGALIAIERYIGMRSTAETGTLINTALNTELLATIFYPNTPLHDGGVIIKNGRLIAAGCIFPLSQNEEISKSLGTRHRAAVGMTEETDCVSIIASEETGKVSLAYMGHLVRDIDEDRMRRHLTNYLIKVKDRERVRKDSTEKETKESK